MMPAKSKKREQQSEAMLMRVIRVAEILAKGEPEATQPVSKETGLSPESVHSQSMQAQKTQT
jgi:hypothetical protein